MKLSLKFITVLLIFFVPSSLYADDKNMDAIFNPTIFSLSKKKENAFDSTSATYVLSSEDIRRSGVTSIPEALRLVPGVQVARMSGNTWAISIRGFNRQFSNKLLVLIDGRVVYTQLFSGVGWDLHDYVLEDIDRVEVVRGPGGTIWGANAVNGVINIITKNAAQTQGFYASQIVGNEDKSITELRYGGKTAANDNYRFYVKRSERDSVKRYSTRVDNKDGYRQDRAGFRYDVSSLKGNTISVHGDVFNGKSQNFFAKLPVAEGNDRRSTGANIVLDWDKKLSDKSNLALQTYYDYDKFDLPVLGRTSSTIYADFQHFYNFSRDNQFVWGLGYKQVIDKIRVGTTNDGYVPINYYPNKRNDELFSAFIQDKFGIIADKLYVTLGSKFMHNDFTGFEYQPSAKLAFYPTRNQTVWAAVSRAVRTPTRGEDDIELLNADSDSAPSRSLKLNIGSDNYESEELIAYEMGYRIKPTFKTMIDATAFYNDYSKLRTFESSTYYAPAGGYINPTAANNGYGESYGFEISGKWQVTGDWRLESSYDYFKMNLHLKAGSVDDQTIIGSKDGLQVAEGMSPEHQFKLKSFYNITPEFEFDNIIYYVDNLPMASANGYKYSGLPSYVRFDTRFGYVPNRNFDLSVGIQNLFDQRHREFKRSTYNYQTEFGRTYYVKGVYRY